MSEEKKILSDADLDSVSGGYTKELAAAYEVIRGTYGNGADRVAGLKKDGLDPNVVQGLVNSLLAGYDKVARDVINGKYGNDAARIANLRKAGYSDAEISSIQTLVNHTLWR